MRVARWFPSGPRWRLEQALEEGEGDRGVQPGVTPHQARRRFAAARVARLATADAAGRPHIVPVTFAVDGDVVYSAVDAKPAGHCAQAARQRRGQPGRGAARRPLRGRLERTVVGTRRRHRPRGRPGGPPRAHARCRCSPTATRASPRGGPCSPSTYAAGQAGRRRPRPRKAEMVLLPIDRGPQMADCSCVRRQGV